MLDKSVAPRADVFRIPCPQCDYQFDPVAVAKLLPLEVLVSERGRRNGLMPRRRAPGTGRPKGVARCPSCLDSFSLEDLRGHWHQCLTAKLHGYKTSAQRVHIKPMDPNQYPDFHVGDVRDETVVLHKQSNRQDVEIPLRAIREIVPSVGREPAVITLRGALRWKGDGQVWRFSTE